MDRIQRSGLIALAVLLLTAFGAYYVGSLPGSSAKISSRLAAQDPAALEGVKFLPPEQRKFFVGPEDFVRPPVRNPLFGGAGRNVSAAGDPLTPANKNDDNGGAGRSRLSGPANNSNAGIQVPIPPQNPGIRNNNLRGQSDARKGYIRVVENDNLTRIAQRALGDKNRWQEIAELNQIPKPYKVELGQLLWLPNGESGEQSQPNPPNGGGQASTNTSQRAESTYRVGKDETLSHISRRFYGTTRHWKRILDHNGMKDPSDLKAGQEIRIPRLQ